MPSGRKASTGSLSTKLSSESAVKELNYRVKHLYMNHIYLCANCDKIPESPESLIAEFRGQRSSPPSSQSEFNALAVLERDGGAETDVEEFLSTHIFPPKRTLNLQRDDRLPMRKHLVPNSHPDYKLTTTIPDKLFGHPLGPSLFTGRKYTQLLAMEKLSLPTAGHRYFHSLLSSAKATLPLQRTVSLSRLISVLEVASHVLTQQNQ
jgi:hypothetical protein